MQETRRGVGNILSCGQPVPAGVISRAKATIYEPRAALIAGQEFAPGPSYQPGATHSEARTDPTTGIGVVFRDHSRVEGDNRAD
jgi:hypothetical protein